MLVGTWTTMLNADGTFRTVRHWRKLGQKFFVGLVRLCGTWKVRDDNLIVTIAVSNHYHGVGQVSTVRISSIDPFEVMYIGEFGRAKSDLLMK